MLDVTDTRNFEKEFTKLTVKDSLVHSVPSTFNAATNGPSNVLTSLTSSRTRQHDAALPDIAKVYNTIAFIIIIIDVVIILSAVLLSDLSVL